jgi:hypothetical protein
MGDASPAPAVDQIATARQKASRARGLVGRPAPPSFLVNGGTAQAAKLPASADAYELELRGPNPRSPIDFYREELRQQPWAGAMEQALARRFAADRLAQIGLAGLKLDALECRRSSCRLEVSWSELDVAAAAKTRESVRFAPDPLGFFELKTGPLARVTARMDPPPGEPTLTNSYHVRVKADGRQAVTEILLFSGSALNP